MPFCGGLWSFAVVCGSLGWFAMVCGGLSYSHTVNHRRNAELELHSVDRSIGKVSVNKRKIHQSTVLCLFIETNQIQNKHLQCIHSASLANIILV